MEEKRNKTNQTKNSISHATSLLNAAIPYAGRQTRQTLTMMAKVTDLVESIQSKGENILSACDLEDDHADLEGMLNHMKEICTDNEKEFVDIILNFIQANKFYRTYRSVQGAGKDGKDTKNPLTSMFGLGDSSNMMDILQSMLTPEQQSTFQNMSMLFNTMQNAS